MLVISLHTNFQMNRKAPPSSPNLGGQTSSAAEGYLDGWNEAAMLPGITATDVLCGRDKVSHAHCGNRRFRHIIEMNRTAYQNALCREAKTKITCEVVDMIRTCGGRFLKLNEETGEWLDVGDNYAKEKVSHALRSAKDPNRPRTKKPRKVTKHVPTAEEDAQFDKALQQQQTIYESLLQQEREEGQSSKSDDPTS